EHDRGRIIEAEWQVEEEISGKYPAEITIYANNRNGLLVDVSRVLTENNISIVSLNTRVNKQGIATMNIAFEVSTRDELSKLIDKLRQIQSIKDIERTKG
ncbi:MAG: bifunctional (p)ppGpp synthetase/guanosine-3',5'-bis(diphosphate) 3'-pyrophosphohydrolase, partial [Lachnospiraceae bacterium]|nr:bifunctional (p)ppGpp synthetase/guanosine-3',5'-bis(diphosphate) 3'-pyrophosphohydrolase [Lachnospiraceae bacterium]